MSIILEALKKASANENIPSATPIPTASTAKPRQESYEAKKIEPPAQANDFRLSQLTFPLTAIVIVSVIAFFAAIIGRETPVHNTESKNMALKPSAEAKIAVVAEGYTTAPRQIKEEKTPIGNLMTRLSNPRLALSGIVYGIGEPAAIIENKILEEGASIKGFKVKKIHSDNVEMLDETTGQTFVLKVN